jgi:tetraacyldisaccharide 4'-kinase
MRFFEKKWPAILLWPVSLLYWTAISLRNSLYDLHVFKIHRLPCFVISVGNISVGGTGKTPTVLAIAQQLLSLHKRICILSRGYGRESKNTVIVADEQGLRSTVVQAGDEPYLLARHLKNVPIIVDSDRVRGARISIEKFNPDVILLDDGFQHRRLFRDVDIVTFKLPNPFGNGFLLPAGPLREPVSRLNRARIFWLNFDSLSDATEFAVRPPWDKVSVIKAHYKVKQIIDARGHVYEPLLQGIPVLAFCGLGNPEGFRSSLLSMGADIKEFVIFPDHHVYTSREMAYLNQKAQTSQSKLIITTEKDWVKITPVFETGHSWRYVVINVVPENTDAIRQLVTPTN